MRFLRRLIPSLHVHELYWVAVCLGVGLVAMLTQFAATGGV